MPKASPTKMVMPVTKKIHSERIHHAFEAGRRGKPDELDAGLAHLVGAYFLELEPNARFDLRVTGSYTDKPTVRVSGEVSARLLSSPHVEEALSNIIREHYNNIQRSHLPTEDITIQFNLKPQSDELAANDASGDSGYAIAVAYKDAPLHLPWERYAAVGIRDLLDTIYLNGGVVPGELAKASGVALLPGLRADGKIGVEAIYEGTTFLGFKSITLATEHEEALPVEELRVKVQKLIHAYLQNIGNPAPDDIEINGLGGWHEGGWKVDEGSREAKSYRDGFASYGVVEDSFSGEAPTKPSGTGTFLARYIAVQLVGNNLADFARVALSYTIGKEEVGLNIVTNGTSSLSQTDLEKVIRFQIPLGIRDTIQKFDLRNPKLYRKIVEDSDYFHGGGLPWNSVRELVRPLDLA